MKTRIIKSGKGLLAAGLMVLCMGQPVAADSLYEYYTSASHGELKTETREMGKQLSGVFNQKEISARQRQIDFGEYYANLRKLVFFSAKLTTYSEYETDLQFAKDNEVFKGLPEEPHDSSNEDRYQDRKDFVEKKYVRMKINIQEEIDTYLDLIQISLDACETLSANDLSGFIDDPECRNKMQHFIEGKEFKSYYRDNHSRLTQRWPELADRISLQLALWQPRPLSPDDPLLDPKITGAI
jgi:hypothetical protein